MSLPFPGRDRHSLAAPYALDALAPREAERFERHLARCPRCAGEVGELRESAVRLAVAVAEPAPHALRARVLAAVRTEAQEPAVERAPAERTRPEATPRAPGRRWRQSPWPARLLAAGAALSLAAAAVFGVVLSRTSADLDREKARNRAVAAVLDAPDATSVRSAAADGRTLRAVVSRDRGSAVVFVHRPRPRPGRVYQLWAMEAQPGPIRSAGLFEGDAPLLVSGLKGPVTKLAVTDEPAGGSRQPTSDPLAQVELPAA